MPVARTKGDHVALMLECHQRLIGLCSTRRMELLDTHNVTGLTLTAADNGMVTTRGLAPLDKYLIVGMMLSDIDTPWLWLRVGCMLQAKVFYEKTCFITIPPRQDYGFQLSCDVQAMCDSYKHAPCKVRLYGWAIDEKLVLQALAALPGTGGIHGTIDPSELPQGEVG